MENQIVLIIGLAFVAALGFILKQANTTTGNTKAIKEKPQKKVKPVKPKKQPQKKSQRRAAEITEWIGVDSAAKDAQDMLEFLKGKDPKEISKALKASQTPVKKVKAPVQPPVQQNKKGKNQKEAKSQDSSSDADQDGFALIQKKAPKQKKDDKKNNKEEEDKKNQEKSPRVKSFFKGEEEERKKQREAEKEARAKERKERGEADKKERKERPPRKERPLSEGEGQSEQSDRPRRERKERPEGEEREKRVIVAPTVPKYETADMNDILASFTKDFKSKQREDSLFSKIPRNIVVDKILPYLNAKELIYLSRVNQYFKNATKKESLWKALFIKEFPNVNTSGIKSFKREFRKRKTGKKDEKKAKAQE